MIIGDDVGIGPNVMISAINAKFILKGYSAIAEGLSVHSGNHARVKGFLLSDIT